MSSRSSLAVFKIEAHAVEMEINSGGEHERVDCSV